MQGMAGHEGDAGPHGAAPGSHGAERRQGKAYGRARGVIDPTKPATGGRRSKQYVDATGNRLPTST